MPAGKWLDRSQPQTLMNATLLLYINAALGLLFLLLGAPAFGLLAIVGQAVSGWGIANEKKWAYWLAVVVVVLLLADLVLFFSGVNIINLLFYAVLLILLLHPQSREYRRIWFH